MKRVLSVFIFVSAASFGYAQDTLSLARAVQVGLKNNFDIQIGALNLDIAKNNNNWGQAGLYPTIKLIANQPNNIVQRKPANPLR
ncbi:MAG: hypothetical protein IPJ20_03020 [Flammeovirgaceae bacterium]|nr:hypothetical protein [Flammeovirgaceae bacterium]